jgi:hypothetical protein
VFVIYAFDYGLWEFTGHSIEYGLIVFGLPVFFIFHLYNGVFANIKDLDNDEYFAGLSALDGHAQNMPHLVRRHFRGFRGYGGYGGSGLGGYNGGGMYRGGGFGGGFGG